MNKGTETIYFRLGLLTQPKPCLGLELQHGWDSNPVKTHGTWFQDLIKLGRKKKNDQKNERLQ